MGMLLHRTLLMIEQNRKAEKKNISEESLNQENQNIPQEKPEKKAKKK